MGDVDKSTLFGYINAQIAGLNLQSGQSVELRVDSMLQGIDVTIILTPRQNEVKRTVKENNVSMEGVVTGFQEMLRERRVGPGESIQLKVMGFVGCDIEIIATARGERPQTP